MIEKIHSQQEEQSDSDQPGSSVQSDERTQSAGYFPVFSLTNVPEEYNEVFGHHAVKEEIPYIGMTCNNPNRVLEHLKESEAKMRNDICGQTPFLNNSVDQIYDFYKHHLRTLNTATRDYFTNFTFFVIDKFCVQSNPKQCVVCCDAPDFDEPGDEPKLKLLRIPIEKAMPYMYCLEHLSMTPSEVGNPSGMVFNVMPNPYMMPLSDERTVGALFGQVRAATPVEARANKKKAILFKPGVPDDRATTIVEVPAEDCNYTGPSEGNAKPLTGSTGIFFDHSKQTVNMCLGDNMPYHADHVRYHQAVYPTASKSPVVVSMEKKGGAIPRRKANPYLIAN